MNEQTFAEKLKRYRREKGLTQQELADTLGVSNKTVSRWESCGGYPDVALLVPLARALGVTVDDLLDDARPVRTLTRTDWQNLLSYAFVLGGGLLYFLLSGAVPTLLCYGIFIACLCYGAYLQRYYAYRSKWFFALSLIMALFVHFSISTAAVLFAWVAALYGAGITSAWGKLGELLGDGALYEMMDGGVQMVATAAVLALVLTAVTGCLLWRYGVVKDGAERTPLRLTLGRPSLPDCVPALFPLAYAALMLPFWEAAVQRRVLLIGLAVMAVIAVLLFRKRGRRRMLFPTAVLLILCHLLQGTVTFVSQSMNTGKWFEGIKNSAYFDIYHRPSWGTWLGAAVLAVLWLGCCCLRLKPRRGASDAGTEA